MALGSQEVRTKGRGGTDMSTTGPELPQGQAAVALGWEMRILVGLRRSCACLVQGRFLHVKCC